MKFYLPLVLLALAGCQTTNITFEEGSNPEMYFHRAQLAVDNKDYASALRIYQLFLDTKPVDPGYLVSAEYEIGFMNYKLEQPSEAVTWLGKALARYSDPDQVKFLPAWPKVLAEKVLAKLAP